MSDVLDRLKAALAERYRVEREGYAYTPVRGYSGCPGVPMTDPQAGKQPSSGTNRPVPGMRATGDCPGTLIPLTGCLQYQGRYLGDSKFLL